MERLHKALARAGVASRRKAEALIAAGRVRVNGALVTGPGVQIDPAHDLIEVDGHPLPPASARTYLMLNKPAGVVSTRADERGRKTVMELLPAQLRHLHPVGRLDADTEGLLLLTDDGALTYRVTHPRHAMTKTYRATVQHRVEPATIERLAAGVLLEDGPTAPCRARLVRSARASSEVELILHEGRKRQVRRMLATLGHPVVRLRRVRVAGLTLGALKPGEFRLLTAREVNELLHD